MPRRNRIIVPNYPHHITQRGSRKMDVFFCDQDRLTYMQLLSKYAELYGVQIVAYCLMTNHIHHILVPLEQDSISQTLKLTHMRYASLINARMNWTGHLWQQRFYSSPLDENYFWHAVRYLEQNPIKANLARKPYDYCWSSAAEYCAIRPIKYINTTNKWVNMILMKEDYNTWISEHEDIEAVDRIRNNTSRDLPCGERDFISKIEIDIDQRLPLSL